MRRQRTSGTKPEQVVGRVLRKLGLSTVRRKLPGTPDFIVGRTAVFVHGCFWHSCPRCGERKCKGPNAAAWRAKFINNRARDARKDAELRALGWETLTVWEHETKQPLRLEARLAAHFRGSARASGPRKTTRR